MAINKNKCSQCEGKIFPQDVRIHPVLGVTCCAACYQSYIQVGDLSQYRNGVDLDGGDNYCRWCLDGGDLILCTDERCRNGFCANCIERNFGEEKRSQIENSGTWYCFICNYVQLDHKRTRKSIPSLENRPPLKIQICLNDHTYGIDNVESVPKSIEPATKSAEPVSKNSEPVPKSIEPATKSAEPVSKSSEPVPKSIEPATKSAEPASKNSEPLPKSIEPATKSAESASKNSEPLPKSIEPATKSAEPASKNSEPLPKSIEPATKSAESASKNSKPVPKSIEPTLRNVESVPRNTELVTKNFESESQNAELVSKRLEQPEVVAQVVENVELPPKNVMPAAKNVEPVGRRLELDPQNVGLALSVEPDPKLGESTLKSVEPASKGTEPQSVNTVLAPRGVESTSKSMELDSERLEPRSKDARSMTKPAPQSVELAGKVVQPASKSVESTYSVELASDKTIPAPWIVEPTTKSAESAPKSVEPKSKNTEQVTKSADSTNRNLKLATKSLGPTNKSGELPSKQPVKRPLKLDFNLFSSSNLFQYNLPKNPRLTRPEPESLKQNSINAVEPKQAIQSTLTQATGSNSQVVTKITAEKPKMPTIDLDSIEKELDLSDCDSEEFEEANEVLSSSTKAPTPAIEAPIVCQISQPTPDKEIVEALNAITTRADVPANQVDSRFVTWAMKDANIIKEHLELFSKAIMTSLKTYDEARFARNPMDLLSWKSNLVAFLEQSPTLIGRCSHLDNYIQYFNPQNDKKS